MGLPLILGTVMVFITAANILAPAETRNTSTATGVLIGGVGMLIAQGLTSSLIERWIREQR